MIFKPKDYSYPASLAPEYYPAKKATVTVTDDEILTAAAHGASWQQLENYYMVDEDSLKKHFMCAFIQGRAMGEINLLNTLVRTAVAGQPAILKFVSTNWLGMVDKVTNQIIEAPADIKDIDARILKLQQKLGIPSTKE